jgi:hypothetical protein
LPSLHPISLTAVAPRTVEILAPLAPGKCKSHLKMRPMHSKLANFQASSSRTAVFTSVELSASNHCFTFQTALNIDGIGCLSENFWISINNPIYNLFATKFALPRQQSSELLEWKWETSYPISLEINVCLHPITNHFHHQGINFLQRLITVDYYFFFDVIFISIDP